MTPRRLFLPTALLLLAAGGGAWVAARRTWATAQIHGGEQSVSVTGADVASVVPALAVVFLAASVAILAAPPRLKQVLGGLVLLLAVVGSVAAVTDPHAAVQRALEASTWWSPAGAASPEQTSAWRFAAVGAFALAGVCGLITLLFGRFWTGLSGRYEPPLGHDPGVDVSETDLWKAFDHGIDPTL